VLDGFFNNGAERLALNNADQLQRFVGSLRNLDGDPLQAADQKEKTIQDIHVKGKRFVLAAMAAKQICRAIACLELSAAAPCRRSCV
jgi:hypothetical protein